MVVVGETTNVLPLAVGDTTLAPGHEPVYHFMTPPPAPTEAVTVTVPPEQLGLGLKLRPVGGDCCGVTTTVTDAHAEMPQVLCLET